MRKVGFAALEQHKQQRQQFQRVGSQLKREEAEQLTAQLRELQATLQRLGSDPQITANKELWSEYSKLCGRAGLVQRTDDGLAMRVIEVCRATFKENGGIISLRRMRSILQAQDGDAISERQIEAALRGLAPLGTGMEIETLSSGVKVISGMAHELSHDHADLIVACDAMGFVSVSIVQANLGWTKDRAKRSLEEMVMQGLLWEDMQAAEVEYWAPGAA